MKKKWYLLLFTMGAAILLFWLWHLFIYRPLVVQEDARLGVIAVLEQKRLLIPDLQHRVELLKRHNTQVRQELQFHLLSKESIDPYITLEHVLLSIDALGLRLVSLAPQEFKRKTFYEKCSFGFKVLGSYEHIMQLFGRFCERHARSTFKQVNLTRKNDELLLDAVMVVYVIDKDGL